MISSKTTKILLATFLFMVIGVLVAYYYNSNINTKHVAFMENNLPEIGLVAQRFYADKMIVLQNHGDNTFELKGDYFNLEQPSFIVGGGPLGSGQNISETEFYSRTGKNRSILQYYVDFFKKYSFVLQIEEAVNLKQNGTYSILFFLDNRSGFMYVSDGTLEKDVNLEYLDDTFSSLEGIAQSWYRFETKRPYGI